MPFPEDENEWKKLLVIFRANGNVRKNTWKIFLILMQMVKLQ